MSDFSFPPKYFPQIIAVKAVIRHHDKYLIIKEASSASWKPDRLGLPGGKIDPGEDWSMALKRELKEEIQAEATVKGIISFEEIVYHHPKLNLDQLTHHFIFLCEISDETYAQLSKQENIFWHTLDELKKIPNEEMTEYYFTKLWEQLSNQSFKTIPSEMIRVWDGLHDLDFQKWYSKS